MQKKIIALAIAGLASTAAFAQSNVTIYGSMDFGYSYRYDALDGTANNVNSQSALDSGITQGNRLGFKGVEDLGNGLKAVFVTEMGFDGGTGASTQGGLAFGRQAYVGLTGGFGTVVGGRLYTPWHTFVSAVDPFASGTVGQYKNLAGSDVVGLFDPARVDNAVAYISPSFGGFTLTGAYSNNAIGQENANFNSQNNTVYALLGQYSAGPVMVGLNYHYVAPSAQDTTPATVNGANPVLATRAVDSIQNATLGGTFDMTVAKLHAMYSYNELKLEAGDKIKMDNVLLGVSVPVGKVTIKGSYIWSDADFNDGTAQQFAVGANYAFSKRTDLYTAFSYIDNDVNRAAITGDATRATYSSTNLLGNATPGTVFQQGFQVGVRHTF